MFYIPVHVEPETKIYTAYPSYLFVFLLQNFQNPITYG